MKLRPLLSFVFIITSIIFVSAQGIRGRISNPQNEAIPFATIYIPGLTTGTTTNAEGKYELKLPQGKQVVLFQCLGYQTQTVEIQVGSDFQEKNIRLQVQDYQIPEIKVLASGEDPAYYIMRRAIAMAPYYQKQVSKYSCKVYLKGSGVFEKIPFLLEKQMKKEGIRENQPFVMETVSKIDFELPDKLKQQVLAMRSSGKQNNTSPMGMITNNLYDADKYGIVSPFGRNALKTYRFKLEGIFTDQGRTINKIKVIPKSNSSDVFSGYIYIADSYWNIHSADLKLHVPMTDVIVHQLYGEVNKNTFMPVSLDFDMDFSGLGIKMKYKYVASINEYSTTLNPALDHTFIDRIKGEQLKEQQVVQDFLTQEKNEQEKAEKSKAQARIDALMQKQKLSNRETVRLNRLIETEAQRNSPPEPLEIKSTFVVSPKQEKNDSAYWNSLRPIPLTDTEKKSFASKDSFLLKASQPEFKDSVRNMKRKFKAKHLLMGKTYNYSVDSIRQYEHFTIPGLMNPGTLSFNSVDGLRADLPFSYSKADSMGHRLTLTSQLGYAFAREKLDASFRFARKWDGMTNSWVAFSLGSITSDFNRGRGMSSLDNDLYTLWFEKNYKRFYRRDFVMINASRDLANGLNFALTVDYSDNRQLSNHSSYSVIKYDDREIQPNIPDNNLLQSWQTGGHQAFTTHLQVEYTPRLRYRVINHSKIYVRSKYPTFSMAYNRAFANFFGSDAKYDLLRAGIRQKVGFGVDSQFSYQVDMGGFLNTDRLYFEDFMHFNALPVNFSFSSFENSFRLLPLYRYSTNSRFFNGHVNLQSRKLLLKQLPLVRNSSFSEKLFVNYLTTPQMSNYVETGYGINNLFLLLNMEVVAGFENGRYRSAGIKVSMNLK